MESYTPLMKRRLIALFIPLLLLTSYFSISAEASSSLATILEGSASPPLESTDTSSDTPFALSTSSEFLAVEEAYQLSVTATEQGLKLDWVIADGYFLYGEQFRVLINGTPVTAKLPTGIIQYDPIFEKEVEKHYQHAVVKIASDQLPPHVSSTPTVFQLSVTSQGCADAGLCYPPHTQYFSVNGNTITPLAAPSANNAEGQTKSVNAIAGDTDSVTPIQVIAMLGFALLGGMILNLMPCVLPVLSLKALSLSNSASNHRHQGWSYTFGAITAFIAMAGLLLAVRAAGQAVG